MHFFSLVKKRPQIDFSHQNLCGENRNSVVKDLIKLLHTWQMPFEFIDYFHFKITTQNKRI